MKFKINVNLKVFCYTFLILVTLLGLSSALYLDQYKQRLLDKVLTKAKLVVRLSNLVIINDITNYNDISLLAHIEKIESVDDILYAIIFSNNGTVIGHSDVYEIGNKYKDPLTTWAIETKDFSYKDHVEEGKSILVCAAPIVDKELGPIAYIRFGMSKDSVVTGLKKENKYVFIFNFIFTSLFLIIFLLIFYIDIAKPLTMIKEGIILMKKNLTNFKFKLNKHDEIGEIYSGINSLINEISGVIKSKEHGNDEILVAEEKRLEKIVTSMIANETSDILVVNSENKIIFAKLHKNSFLKGNVIDLHVVDIVSNPDLIRILTDAYSSKNTLIKDTIEIDSKQYSASVFSIEEIKPFLTKTIIILSSI